MTRIPRTALCLSACIAALLLFGVNIARAAFAWESLVPHDAVTDDAGLLDSGQRNQLESQLAAYYNSTGNALVLVTLKDLDGGDIDDAANRIYQKAGIGKKGVDRGVLLLISLQDRKMRIEVGYGLEGVLTDAVCARIIQADMVPAFKSGNYAQGISAAFDRMEKIIGGDASAVPKPEGGKGTSPGGILIIVAIIIFIFIFGRKHGTNGRGPTYRSGPIIGGGGFGGGGFSGGGGGSFGGFGGGMSGGGGAHGGW